MLLRRIGQHGMSGEGNTMRILVITNLYPPHIIGGYELLCKEQVEYLQAAGHQVTVLTSYYGLNKPAVEGNVHRILCDIDQPKRKKKKMLSAISDHFPNRDIPIVKTFIKKHQPDLLYIFTLDRLTPFLLPYLLTLSLPKVYFVSDYWIHINTSELDERVTYWSTTPKNKIKQLLKNLLRKMVLKNINYDKNRLPNETIIFTSYHLLESYQKQGLSFKNYKIIYNSINTERYPAVPQNPDNTIIKILYVGQVMDHKGVHTIIEAVHGLKEISNLPQVKCTIVGNSTNQNYVTYLKKLVADFQLQDCVVFQPAVKREEVIHFYHNADIFVFPSIWEEPFSLTLLEAMACGLPVIGTTTGGSKEILTDRENCLVFPAGNSDALSMAMVELINDKQLRTKIATNARNVVLKGFDKQKKFKEIQHFLEGSISKGFES